MAIKKKLSDILPEGSAGAESLKYADVTPEQLNQLDPTVAQFVKLKRDAALSLLDSNPELKQAYLDEKSSVSLTTPPTSWDARDKTVGLPMAQMMPMLDPVGPQVNTQHLAMSQNPAGSLPVSTGSAFTATGMNKMMTPPVGSNGQMPAIGGDAPGIDFAKVKKFREAMIAKGEDPNNVDAFIGNRLGEIQKRQQELTDYGLKLQMSKSNALSEYKDKAEIDRQTKIDQQLANPSGSPEVDQMDDKTVISEFVKQFGSNAYSKLRTSQSERPTMARAMLAEYKKNGTINVTNLLNDKELASWDAQDTLSNNLTFAINAFTNQEGPFGTGPLAGITPDSGPLSALNPEKTKILRGALTDISSQKIKDLSGVAVSDKEFERLNALLPDKYQSETENLRRLTVMKARIEANKELVALAKMNNLSNSDVVKKYGSQVWTKYGLGPSGENPSATNPETSKATTGGLTDDEIKKLLQ